MARNETVTPGRDALREWLKQQDRGSYQRLAETLDVTVALVSQWASGACRPGQVYREALARVASIAVEDWETAEERKRRKKLEALPSSDPTEAP